jgi:hypothetical protein
MSKSVSKQSNRKKVRFPYTIIIPSEQQPELLYTHTLTLLRAYRIPRESIIITVPSTEQETLYKARIPSDLYGVVISIHAPYLSAEFYNRISNRFPEGIPLVYLADNLQGVFQKEAHVTSTLLPVTNLWEVFKQGFQECEKAHSQIWGIYPVANGHFMSQTVSTQLKYLPGWMWGCFNPGSSAIHLSMNDLVDYERSIVFWKTFGSVVRLNWIACHSVSHPTIQSNRPAKKLSKLYPEHVSLEKDTHGILHVRLQV